MGAGPRFTKPSHETAKLDGIVNKQVLHRFRTALMTRHGSVYKYTGAELTRALDNHATLMFAEAQQLSPADKAKVARQIMPEKTDGALFVGGDEGSGQDGLREY